MCSIASRWVRRVRGTRRRRLRSTKPRALSPDSVTIRSETPATWVDSVRESLSPALSSDRTFRYVIQKVRHSAGPFVFLALLAGAAHAAGPAYIGAEACGACHASNFAGQ